MEGEAILLPARVIGDCGALLAGEVGCRDEEACDDALEATVWPGERKEAARGFLLLYGAGALGDRGGLLFPETLLVDTFRALDRVDFVSCSCCC